MPKFIRALYFSNLFWGLLIGLVLLLALSFVFSVLFPLARLAVLLFFVVAAIDGWLLFRPKSAFFARRQTPERLSNGDENPIGIYLENSYGFWVSVEVIDEIPFQFQRRDVLFSTRLQPAEVQTLSYSLRPVKRGEYNFGAVNVFIMSSLRLIKRRYSFSQNKTVAVYPSFVQMKQYEFRAVSNHLTNAGIKKVRRLGHSSEFEQIRTYILGDDLRTINWKATARRQTPSGMGLMVNAYQEEKSQAIYCLIDKSRVMKSPFEGLSLLDYAINATLVLSHIALLKQDRAGVLTFGETMGQMLAADKKAGQIQRILELLYKQKTRFLESDYQALCAQVQTHVRQRSLLVLFSNFETVAALNRQMPYLRRMAKAHLLVVVFFENTELTQTRNEVAQNTEQIYLKTIAEKFFYEKKQIVKELQKYGIQAILTPPKDLTVSTINKYLELKARNMI